MLDARPVQGFYRSLRSRANAVLIAVLFAVPWIRIAGEPLVLLDVPGRRFHVFGLVLFPQELFLLWLIVAGLALGLFFFTALAGRLWCGWACPQTVFTDVFASVARRIQGWTRGGRPRRVAAWRRAATHAAWIGIAAVIGLHVVGYFHPIGDLLRRLVHGEWTGASTGFWLAATALCYADFGLVRQTFCKYLCPYARLQSVLLDSESLVVAYDPLRGEPRGKRRSAEHGDCVDCGLCVTACPTGIDIRNGLQLECIGCTQCIDACNGVMARIDRPAGLIDYRSLASLDGRRTRWLRPRVVIYGVLLLAIGAGFVTTVAARVPLGLEVERNRASLFQRMPDGRIANAYTLHLQNRDRRAHAVRLRLAGDAGYQLVAGVNPLPLPALGSVTASVFVIAESDADAVREGRGESRANGANRVIHFVVEDLERLDRPVHRESTFVSSPAAHGDDRNQKEDEHAG